MALPTVAVAIALDVGVLFSELMTMLAVGFVVEAVVTASAHGLVFVEID